MNAIGNLAIHAELARVNDAILPLTQLELLLLNRLAAEKGACVTPDQIHGALYGETSGPASNSIQVLVYRLRKKLERYKAAATIITLRGRGYLLEELPLHMQAASA